MQRRVVVTDVAPLATVLVETLSADTESGNAVCEIVWSRRPARKVGMFSRCTAVAQVLKDSDCLLSMSVTLKSIAYKIHDSISNETIVVLTRSQRNAPPIDC